MDDVTKPPVVPDKEQAVKDASTTTPTTPSDSTGTTIPVTVARDEEKPKSAPEVPLETFDPNSTDVPPPAAPDDNDRTALDASIPAAPLDAQANQPKPISTAPSGKTLQELLAEEEAKNPKPEMEDKHNHHSHGKGVMVLVVVLLLLALAGGAALAYIQTSKKVQPASTTNKTPTITKTTTKATDSDIDKTSSDLDASLKKIDDSNDYSANDLSDSSLGL